MVELVVKLVAGRIPVIAGAGSNNPVEAIEYTRYAEQMGRMPPCMWPVTTTAPIRKGSITSAMRCGRHHQTHHRLQHSARAIVDVQPATLACLAELPRIAGVKGCHR